MEEVSLLDVDGTILNSALVIDFLGELDPENEVYLTWKKDKKNEELIDKCGTEFSKVISKFSKVELSKYIHSCLNKQTINNYVDSYFNQTPVKNHILISGTPQFLIDELCKKLNHLYPKLQFMGYGSKLEETEDRYTGKYILRQYIREEKEKVVEKISENYKIIYGFGDTFSDEPILRYAQFKYLISPTQKTISTYSNYTDYNIIIL